MVFILQDDNREKLKERVLTYCSQGWKKKGKQYNFRGIWYQAIESSLGDPWGSF